jgi:hypothetical protein
LNTESIDAIAWSIHQAVIREYESPHEDHPLVCSTRPECNLEPSLFILLPSSQASAAAAARNHIRSTKRLAAHDICNVKNDRRSPRIKHVSWGRLDVEGKAEPYKDAKLFPGGSREWNWRETGTNHLPGIKPADIQELLDHGARVVVLSRGMKECLQVPPETLDFLKERQIAVHVLPTADAAQLYNLLAEKEAVGGLFHTTC